MVSFGRLPTWFSLGLWGVLGTSAVASGIWRWAKRTTVLEVGRGRIAAAWPLSPWPGRWIPASAVQEISSEPAPKGTGLQTVIAKLVGGGKVVLVDDVDSTDVNGVVHGITRALRQPAPALLPEIHVASGERQAQVEWNCGRAVSARIEPTSLSVKCAGEPALELDTDFVDTLVVQPAGELRGVARYDLLAISRKGAAQKLVAGEPAREPLELVANEIRRVLKLTG